MPAITVPDLAALPHVSAPHLGSRARPVTGIALAPQSFEGEGFPVRRAFAGIPLRDLDPFVMMDHIDEIEYAPGEAKGTPWHPHRGFEAVTYLMDGALEHRDSFGGLATINAGDMQCMTVGRGLEHSETPPEWLVREGGTIHGLQLWVNLPRAAKLLAPGYQRLNASDLVLLRTSDGRGLIRLIAGTVGDHTGPCRTHAPTALAHITLEPGARVNLPWLPDFNALVYVLSGGGTAGIDGKEIAKGQTAVLGEGNYVALSARSVGTDSSGLDVVVLGGRPIREPVAWTGPFVMNSKAEVLQAYDDYQQGRFGHDRLGR